MVRTKHMAEPKTPPRERHACSGAVQDGVPQGIAAPSRNDRRQGTRRIGIDATGVCGMMFGVQHYAARIIENVLPLAPAYDFTLFCRKQIPAAFRALHSRIKFPIAPFSNRKFCEQFWLSYKMVGTDLSMFHAMYGCPLYCPVPTVMTVHDCFTLRFPERYPAWFRLFTRIGVNRPARKARAIITPSKASKEDIVNLLGIAPEKITVVPHGVDFDTFTRASEQRKEEVRERYGLSKPFLLHLGGFSPIKNTLRIIEAFAAVCNETALRDVLLVFAGAKTWSWEENEAAVRRLGLQDRVVFTGYFPQTDLPALYGAAQALVYPSLIEGFGMPLLEAFACGTPVITSNRSALAEIAGNAAMLVNPESVDELAGAISLMFSNPQARREVQARGSARVASFTWGEAAQRTLAVYERVLRG